MKFWIVITILLLVDCSAYYTAEYECRHKIVYITPFIGGWFARIDCGVQK